MEAADLRPSMSSLGHIHFLTLPMTIAAVDALYVGSDRGLTAAGLTARALGASHVTVATMIASASADKVSDLTDVPSDTVTAQLEHLAAVSEVGGVYVGALAGHASANSVFRYLEGMAVPSVFNCTISGPLGETVLSSRGITAVRDHLGVPNLVMLGRTDAELISEGEINSLDDAQVAAQRVVKRGAQSVLIRCGPLPARFFEVEEVERPDAVFNSDLFYDGEEFALYEAPDLEGLDGIQGASAALGVATLVTLLSGRGLHESLSEAKRFVTESLRATQSLGGPASLQYFWDRPISAHH